MSTARRPAAAACAPGAPGGPRGPLGSHTRSTEAPPPTSPGPARGGECLRGPRQGPVSPLHASDWVPSVQGAPCGSSPPSLPLLQGVEAQQGWGCWDSGGRSRRVCLLGGSGGGSSEVLQGAPGRRSEGSRGAAQREGRGQGAESERGRKRRERSVWRALGPGTGHLGFPCRGGGGGGGVCGERGERGGGVGRAGGRAGGLLGTVRGT